MGWSIGFDSAWQRDIGYGVPALCDHPACSEAIDRGLWYVCGGEPYGGERGCGLYFCGRHQVGEHQRCERCVRGEGPFPAKADLPRWSRHKLRDASWKAWRAQNRQEVANLREALRVDALPQEK